MPYKRKKHFQGRDEIARMVAMYRAGETQAAIARKLKVSQQCVSENLRREGVKMRTTADARRQ